MPTPARKGSQIPPTSPVNALSTSQPRDIPGGTSGSSSTTASHSNFNTNVNTKSSSNANGNNNSKNKNEHLTPSGPRRNNSLSTSPSTNIAIGSGGSDDRHERERQRAQDMDLAMSMSRARSNSTVLSPELKPGLKQRGSSHSHGHGHKHGQGVGHYPATSPSNESPRLLGRGGGRGSTFPKLTEAEEDEMERAKRGGGGDDEEEDDDDDEEGAQGGSDDERSELGSASDVPSRRRRRLEGRRYLDDGGYGYYSNQDQVRSQAVVDDDDRFDLDDGKRGYLSMGVSGGSGGRGSSRRLKTPASRRRPRDRRTSGGGGGGDAGGLGHSDQNSDTDQYDGHVHGGPLSVGSRSSMRFDDHRSDDMGHGHGAGSNGLRSVDGSRISLQDERERRDRGGFDDDEPDNGMGGRRHRGSPRIQTSVMGMSGGMGNQRNHFDFEPMEEFASKEGRSHSNAEHKGDAGSALYDVDTKDMDMDTGAATGTGMGTSTTSSPEWIESASVIQEPILDSGDQKGTIRTSKDLLRQQEDDFSSPLSKTITRASATDADLASPAQDGSGNSNINFVRRRQRKSNNTNPLAHSRRTGRLALFEGFGTALTDDMPPQDQSFTVDVSGETLVNAQGGMSSVHPTKAPRFPKKPLLPPKGYSDFPDPSAPAYTSASRPYRFSFYSNALPATIHARSLAELPAEGQSFEDLFVGRAGDAERKAYEGDAASNLTPSGAATPDQMHAPVPNPKMSLLARAAGAAASKAGNGDTPSSKPDPADDPEANTWWLDVLSPTDEEMRMLAQVFGIHPLTTEDILLEETREKIELFRNYYLVCFRSFDQDPYSQTYLEPLNMYIIVFREGTLSFHFRGTPHPQNVRRRIKSLKDYISVTSDWISYALIDDITDAFGPLIQSIEYEVDGIDELVLILKDTEQSDMLRRIGTCRKKVMGLLRLMGNKADVVKGLAKRCNENWSVAPKSDIGLYLSDIQDHLITMTQNLNHYEKILSRSHSNYLAQISIEMTDANNQINDVLSKLTALGTVLIPMNLVTGLWGMNVHVPGQDIVVGYTWFASILGGLALFAIVGGWFTMRFFGRN